MAGQVAGALQGAPEDSLSFLRSKGLDEAVIAKMRSRCARLSAASVPERVSRNWEFLESSIGVPKRKLPVVLARFPQLLVLGRDEKLQPMVGCLMALGAQPRQLARVIEQFPQLLGHSVEEKLCPLLAFLQGLGLAHDALVKVILRCPRLSSYSIDNKMRPAVSYLHSLGVTLADMPKVVSNCPSLLGCNLDTRIRPTVAFFRDVVGLKPENVAKLATHYPELLLRNPARVLKPAVEVLSSMGFDSQQVAVIVSGFPPVLVKSTRNSVQPKLDFLVNQMHRQLVEVVHYPAYFGFSLHRTIAPRFRRIQQLSIECSLESMLSCNQKKFAEKFCSSV